MFRLKTKWELLKEIVTSWSLIPAPPLKRLRAKPDLCATEDISCTSIETKSVHESHDEDEETVHESFLSFWSDDTVESDFR